MNTLQIINTIRRLQRNTESFLQNFVKYSALTKPPFHNSKLAFDLNLNKFMFLSNIPTTGIKKHNLIFTDTLVIFPGNCNWMLGLRKKCNEDYENRFDYIIGSNVSFYKWYQDLLQKEIPFFQEELQTSDSSTSLKLF